MNHGYDFHLSSSQEARAERLHKEAIIIDLLFQGPLSPAAIPEALSEELKTLCESCRDEPRLYAGMSAKLIARWAAKGRIPACREEWYASGITAGNRQVDPSTLDRLVVSMGEVERQFDAFDWLMKARTAEDIRRAKRDGLKAGIISAQETVGLGTDLDLLDALYDFGMRVLQLTYNTQNFVGSGCAEAHDGGVSNFGGVSLPA